MAKKKELIGTVVSDKMKKTIVVRIIKMAKHPNYNRIIKSFKRFKAHDEKQEAKLGDQVRIVAVRPLSKDKRFKLAGIVKKAEIAGLQIKDDIK